VRGGEGVHLCGIGDRIRGSGHERRTGPVGDVPRAHLVAERLDRGRRRSDPDQSGRDHGSGERRVLGEKAVTRMDGVGTGTPSDVEELVDVEVRLGRAGPAQGEGLVGEPDVQGTAIRVGVHRDR
jgi:hypothetical protein